MPTEPTLGPRSSSTLRRAAKAAPRHKQRRALAQRLGRSLRMETLEDRRVMALWIAAGDGDWNNPANWQGGNVPGVTPGETVAEFQGGSGNINVNGSFSLSNLSLSGNYTLSGGMLNLSGGTLTQTSGTSTLHTELEGTNVAGTLSGGTLVLTHQGNGFNAASSFTVNSSSTLAVAGSALGSAEMRLAGGTLDVRPALSANLARFVQVINNGTTNRLLGISELEVFAAGVPAGPNASATVNANNAPLNNPSDLALLAKGATVHSASTEGGHGVPNEVIDGEEETAGTTWTKQQTGGGAQITINLGQSRDIGTVRVHQRNDSCCQERVSDISVNLYADNGSGGLGTLVATQIYPGQAPTNSFAELTFSTSALTNNPIRVQANSRINLAAGASGALGAVTFDTPNVGLELDAAGANQEFTFTSTVTLNGNNTFNTDTAAAVIAGVVQGATGGLIKTGPSILTLGAANTYGGDTSIQAGIVRLNNNAGLGSEAGGTTILSGATLDIRGFRTGATGGEPIFVSGAGVGGAGAIINTGAAQTTAARNITLQGNTTFGSTARWDIRDTGGAATFNMNGFTLTKVGGADFVLVNTGVVNGGSVNVNTGVFRVEGSTVFTAPGQTITVNSGATLDFYATSAAHNVNIASSGTVSASSSGAPTISGSVNLVGNSTLAANVNLTLSGQVTGGGVLTKTGGGALILTNNANNYTNTTNVNAGALRITQPNALGTTGGVTNVATGAALELSNAVTLASETITLGVNSALRSVGGNNTFNAPHTINGSLNIANTAAGSTFTIASNLNMGDTGALTFSGPGDIQVTGAISDGFSGPFKAGLLEGRLDGNAFNQVNFPTPSALVLGPSKMQVAYANSASSGGIWVDNSTYVYRGQFFVPNNNGDGTGTFAFAENFDDSVLVRIDGVQRLNNGAWNVPTATGAVTLPTGWHDIELRFGQGGGGAGPNNNGGWDTSLGLGIDLTLPIETGTTRASFIAPVDDGTMNLFRAPAPEVTKIGAGTLTLSGNNSYHGQTIVQGGAIVVTNNNSLGTTSSGLTMSGGTTLRSTAALTLADNITGVPATVGAVNSTGTLDAIHVVSSAGTLTLSGNIALGTNRLVLDGAGNTTLTGAISGTAGSVLSPGIAGYFYNLDANGVGNNDTSRLDLLRGPAPDTNSGTVIGMDALTPQFASMVNFIDFGSGTEGTPGTGNLGRAGTNNNMFDGITVSLPNDRVSALYEGLLRVPVDANYAFTTRSDDGSRIWLDVNLDGQFQANELVSDRNAHGGMGDTTGASVSLTAGLYPIKIAHFEGGGGAGMVASWQQTSGASPFAREALRADNGVRGLATQFESNNSVVKRGTGTVILSGSNSYTGNTTIEQGVLRPTIVGAIPTNVVVNAGGTFDVNGLNFSGTPRDVTAAGTGFAGQLGAIVNTAGGEGWIRNLTLSGNATIGTSAGKLNIGGIVDGGGHNLTVVGGGETNLRTDNSLTNLAGVTVNTTGGGRLRMESSQSPAAPLTITVNGGGRLDSWATRSYGNNLTVSLDGGILEANGPAGGFTATYNGPIVVTGASSVVNNKRIDFFGPVSGTGVITKTGGDVLNFRGGVNSLGGLVINAGRVRFENAGFGTWTGPITINAGGILSQWGNGSTAANIVLGGGSLAVENNGTVTYSGNVAVNAASQIDTTAGNVVLTGMVSGAAALNKVGGNTLTFSGNSPAYTGALTSAGTTLVNGNLGASAVNVLSGATLGGDGAIAGTVAIAAGATLAPGGVPGDLETGAVTFQSGSNFVVDLALTTSDQLASSGSVQLNGATLLPSSSVDPAAGMALTLIDAAGGVSGTFAGLPEGEIVTVNGVQYFIRYTANTVQLVRNTPPVAVADTFGPILVNTVYSGNVALNNGSGPDINVEGDATYRLKTDATRGNVTIDANGNFTYTPHTLHSLANDTFEYWLEDDESASWTTVTLVFSRFVVDDEGTLSVMGTGGNDRIIVQHGANDTVSIRYNNVLHSGFAGVEKVVVFGHNGNDTITAGSVRLPVELYGGVGNDYLAGGISDDVVDGGDGNDRLFGNNGFDILLGGGGNDRLSGGNGDDYGYGDHMIDPDNGTPYTFVFEHEDAVNFEVVLPIRLAINPGADTINGDGGNDILDGGPMNDRLNGGNDDDLVRGGTGNDFLDGGNGNDLLLGELGNDTLYGRTGDDVLLGGDGTDGLNGGNGVDLLFGGDFDADLYTDDDLAMLWMQWRDGSYEDATQDLIGILADDGDKDTLNGERDPDWYLLFAQDNIRTLAETREPNEVINLP